MALVESTVVSVAQPPRRKNNKNDKHWLKDRTEHKLSNRWCQSVYRGVTF
jgi:hypothetical protein